MVSDAIAATVAAILEITVKSTKTLFNGLSLLKLSDEIQVVIRELRYGKSEVLDHFYIACCVPSEGGEVIPRHERVTTCHYSEGK